MDYASSHDPTEQDKIYASVDAHTEGDVAVVSPFKCTVSVATQENLAYAIASSCIPTEEDKVYASVNVPTEGDMANCQVPAEQNITSASSSLPAKAEECIYEN